MQGQDWFDNKDLFNMIQELRNELHETRVIVKKYNGLRKDMTDIFLRLTTIEQKEAGKKENSISIREWLLAGVAILSLIVTIFTTAGVIG